MPMKAFSAARSVILAGQRAAAEQCRLIAGQSPLTKEFLQERLRCYILSKYLLTEQEAPVEEDLSVLARQSLSKTMKLSREMVALYDTSAGCSSASSVDTKLALLLQALQKELRVELPLQKAVRVRTVKELTDLIWLAMKDTPEWAVRMG